MSASLRNLALAGAAALALSSPALAGDNGAYHIFPTPAYRAELGKVVPPATPAMNWYGGTVFSKVNVISVIWGSNVNSTTVADAPGFLSAIVNSTYVDQLNVYNTQGLTSVDGKHHGKQTIARGTFFGQVQITPHNNSLTLTDKDIQKELAYQIANGVLPAQKPNNVYMIFFPADVTITVGGLTSCQQFGAYHSASSNKPTKTNVFYGVMPDCGGGFTSITVATSHEFAEATTDNIPTPGSNPAYPQAWNNASGYEIGDLCESHITTLTSGSNSYKVQEVYLNNIPGCGTGTFHSP